MSSHTTLLHLASLLRQRYARRPDFNLFTTLRGASDEVRLHSRFIAAMLDPQAHDLGHAPLQELLSHCGISDFSLEGVRVECERWNIDILVTNTRRQALFIENKINAGDQPEQLVRYHQQLQTSGYQEIHACYLSLDGGDPSANSLGDLRERSYASYTALGYYADMVPWLNNLLGRAALDPPLRESLAQYCQLILQLTGHDMNNDHLTALTETLLQGDNLQSAHDIRLAYDEALVNLHARLWRHLKTRIEQQHPAMAEQLHADSWKNTALDGYCRDYAERRRDSKYFGLYYRIPGYGEEACIGIEIEDAIYWGVYCCKDSDPKSYHAICKQLDEHGHAGSRNVYWPSYRYGQQPMTFRTPNADMLAVLSDPERFDALIATMADESAQLWNICRPL
ncbi:PD-(D/E)XK nuclease family protein [Halomonas cibimaris]|uniref:PDDEXK-like family protein n=1 Tax=Halomonas cibimaris TaxID=657012 RepID=UPI0031DBAE4F